MTHDNERAHEIFNAARELPSAERGPFLDRECGDDDDLRAEVESLLEHFTSAKTIKPATIAPGSGEVKDYRYKPGDRIGNYEIVSELGAGGFGVVYFAQQHEPVRREVALKVLLSKRCTATFIQGFDAERQTLANMSHPGIAHFYDSGLTQHNLPFFVMEYVSGQPITEYCDEHRLSIRQRLSLFADVCKAVQHAHNKGVIHRDLTPNNILVSEDEDGKPRAQIIDFGIARKTDEEAADVMGTLVYMSPEQATRNESVDTRSDIYTLGVVLYELLVGQPPFDSELLKDVALQAQLKMIQEQDPPSPSTKLSGILDDETASIAAARQVKLESLLKLLRRELDWIPRKALQKDPDRRYTSASAFGFDVVRYLQGEAIEAAPDSTAYRMKKLFIRNKGIFIAAAIVFLVLVVGVITNTTLMIRARHAEFATNEQMALVLEQSYFGNIHAAVTAINQDEVSNARRRLDVARDAVTLLELDDPPFEWKYLHAMNDDSLAVRKVNGHEEGVGAVAFSPDGSRIVSGGGFGKTLRVCDVATGEELAVLKGHEDSWVSSVAFSPDGSRIVSGGGDKTLRVWDVTTGEELAVLKGHEGGVNSVAFSPDGSRIVSTALGDSDKSVRMWDAASGEEIDLLKGHKLGVRSVAFSPDGSRIVLGGGDLTSGKVRVWDATTGEELYVLKGHESWVSSVAFSPDGSRIVSAGANDNTVRVWDAASGEELFVLKAHEDHAYCVAFSPDGSRIVSGGSSVENGDNTVRVWDATTGEELAVLKGHEGGVVSVAFSPDGSRIVSAGRDNTVRVWDAASVEEHTVLKGHVNDVLSVAFSPDGSRIVSGSWDQTLRVWDAATGEELAVLKGHKIYVLSPLPDFGFPVSFFDLASGEERIGKNMQDSVFSVAFSPDGSRIVSGGSHRTVRVWDATTGEELIVQKGHESWVSSVAFSPDGSRIVSGGQRGSVRVWDATTGKELIVLKGLKGHEDEDRMIGSSVSSVAFSPDGSRIISGGQRGSVRVWDAASGEELAVLKGHEESYVSSVAFSPDGSRIVSGNSSFDNSDNTVRVWDAASGEELAVLKGHERRVSSVAFSPDGSRIVSGSSDNTVHVWDTASGEELIVLKGHEDSKIAGGVSSVAFSPDGSRIVSGGSDNTVRIWNTKSRSLLAHERRLALRRNADLSHIVDTWIEKADGDSELVLSLLDREVKNRPFEEQATLRNLVLKKLVERREAKQTQDSE